MKFDIEEEINSNLTSGPKGVKSDLHQFIDGDDNVIIISNHPGELDFLYMWLCCMKFKSHNQFKFVAAKGFENIPVFGWCMKFFHFVSISKWVNDKIML